MAAALAVRDTLLTIRIVNDLPVLQMSVPVEIFEHPIYVDVSTRSLEDEGVLGLFDDGDYKVWDINLNPFGKRQSKEKREEKLKALNTVFNAFLAMPYLSDADENPEDHLIAVAFGHHTGYRDGRLGLHAELKRPKNVEDEVISTLATGIMHKTARQLGYERALARKGYGDFVGARFITEKGVGLVVNTAGSSALETDGDMYDPSDDRFELSSHNLMNVDMQLICLTGAVAIAHAESLVKEIDSLTA